MALLFSNNPFGNLPNGSFFLQETLPNIMEAAAERLKQVTHSHQAGGLRQRVVLFAVNGFEFHI